MGCGASKPPEAPDSATEKQSIYRALDVKPPPSASPPKPAAAAELQRPTALQKQAAAERCIPCLPYSAAYLYSVHQYKAPQNALH